MTMATTSTPQRTQPQQGVRRPTARKVRVVVRRINPWSVLKMSLLFYFCLMLVVLVGLGILYGVLDSLGILDTTEDLLSELGFGEGTTGFEFNAGYIFRTLLLIGLISTGLWAALTVFVAFLYNLIADLVGGIEVTLTERR
jgi:Transmembrane domain of unknown function (DUF3566)